MTSPDAPAARPLPSVSAVLPAFNEVAVIADVVERTDAALRASGVPAHEVVVVDDGSRDGTGAAVNAVAGRLRSVRLVTHERNRGYGAALRSGFAAARCEAVWIMDSDAQFDPADLPLLLDLWAPGTVVAGYRADRNDPSLRRLYHAAFFRLVTLTVGTGARDVNCAFKLVPREVVTGLHSNGAMISTELLLTARERGLRVAETAVPHHPRVAGSATGARPAVIARAFGELWSMWRSRRRRRRVPR